MSDNLVHFQKGNLWRTWCGEIPDQCYARIEMDLADVTCGECKSERNKLGRFSAGVLERAECIHAGHFGHQFCGCCEEHGEPRVVCQCVGQCLVPPHDPGGMPR